MHIIKIFDFDGTIADTEKISWEAHNNLLKPYGIRLELEQIQKYIGNCDERIAQMLNEDFDISLNPQTYEVDHRKEYQRLLETTDLKPFQSTLNEIYEDEKAECIILSSNSSETIRKALGMWNLLECFSKIVSVPEIKMSKKEYIKTLLRDYAPRDIYLYEDGIQALNMGKELGIHTIGVITDYNKQLFRGEFCERVLDENDYLSSFIKEETAF